MVVRVAAFVAGIIVLQAVLRSAVRTVVVPRGEPVLLSRFLFLGVRDLYTPLARRHHDPARRHAVLARFAPMALLTLAFVWAAGVILAFVPMFWAVSDVDLAGAFRLSGSSVTTLGFAAPPNGATAILAVGEALLGLGVVALLIAYLPSIYEHFARREEDVLKFEVRAGSPPSPTVYLRRLHAIGWTERLGLIWEPFETWFEDLQESHTSQPSLALYRSQSPANSWITTAGAALDAAAISEAALDHPSQPEAALMLRAGYLALRDIAAFYGLLVDTNPGAQRSDLGLQGRVLRGPRRPRAGRAPRARQPGEGLAGLRRLAGQLRPGAAGVVRPGRRATGRVVLRPLHPVPPAQPASPPQLAGRAPRRADVVVRVVASTP